jgi:ribosome-associated heat shock protein Hsp15
MLETTPECRLDKWLWAARFYKTRALAKEAIEGGKVKIQGMNTKPGKIVKCGMIIDVAQGYDNKRIQVLQLTEKRLSAPQAADLYAETADSIARRENEKALRAASAKIETSGRPTKKQRREFFRFQDAALYE